MVASGWFSLENYNKQLRNFDFSSYESPDKPQLVPEKGNKLPGKAVSLWIHCRNFPLIIRSLVRDECDPVLALALLLVDITARLMAMEFHSYDIVVLEEKIVQYLDNRKVVYEEHPLIGRPKPKHHMMSHYGQAIRLFGPPTSFWTARFESKHRVAKNVVEASKNFKNITHTVAVRQQMRMASIYYKGMFDVQDFYLPEEVYFKSDIQQSSYLPSIVVRESMGMEDFVCKQITHCQQMYRTGDLVVVQVLDWGSMLKIGLIEYILVQKNSVFLILTEFEAVKTNLGYFKVESGTGVVSKLNIYDLADKKPVIKHGTSGQFIFVLHHYVPFTHV